MQLLNDLKKNDQELIIKRINDAVDDPIVFIDRFLYTFDPKREPYHLPFRLFDYQKDLINEIKLAIENGYDILIEKCREMGATYTTLDVLLWFWRYVPGSNFLLGSRKEQYVDNRGQVSDNEVKNKEESLFGKLEYTLDRVQREASFLLPTNFQLKKHLTYMSLLNPENGNVISGESSNPNFSRGGRFKAVLLDEFAFWNDDSSCWGATADTTNCRIVLTTPGIRPSKAKRLRFGKDGEQIKIITLPYDLDPRKTNEWLEAQRSRRSAEDFAREIMINWDVSVAGKVYSEIQYAQLGVYPYNPSWPLYVSWDFGLDGLAIQWWQKNMDNGKKRLVEAFESKDKPIQFYFPFVGSDIDSKFDYSSEDLEVIRNVKEFKRAVHYGDPDVSKRSLLTGTSTRQALEAVKVFVQTNPQSNDFASRREKTKVMLQEGVEVNQTKGTEYWMECMRNARYPQRNENSQSTSEINLPIHDWCLAGETKIRTLDGWFAIKDLVGKDFWVWAYSDERKRMIPVKTSHCWMSGLNKKTILVGLDDGHEIRCTPDHPFMRRDGTYVEAQDLKNGDSLMPFYEKNNGGYVDIALNDGSHGPEHQLVYAEIFGISDQDNHIHHKDDCKWHNSPNNLEEIDPATHCSVTFSGIPNGKRGKVVPSYITYSSRTKIYRNCRFCGKEFLTNHKTFYCSKDCYRENDRKQLRDRARYDEEYRILAKQINKNYEQRHKIKCNFCGYTRSRNAKNCPSCHNHKVRFVKLDMKRVDVYDIEVPAYHNFVAEGVVTHNTSHHRTSTEYMAVNYNEVKKMQSAVVTKVRLDPYD